MVYMLKGFLQVFSLRRFICDVHDRNDDGDGDDVDVDDNTPVCRGQPGSC
jgi:hypothetical protein